MTDTSRPRTEPLIHILLIGANQSGLSVRKAILEEMGCHVVTAKRAEEGLQSFDQDHFSLVITDYKMPGMNGVELIERLRQTRAAIPVILLSGQTDALGLTEESSGANQIVFKNASEATQLKRAVTRLVRPPRKPAQGEGRRGRTKEQSASR
jgi:CheY-like chemotaxis protein